MRCFDYFLPYAAFNNLFTSGFCVVEETTIPFIFRGY